MIQTNNSARRASAPCHPCPTGGRHRKEASEKKVSPRVKKSAIEIYKNPDRTAAAESHPAKAHISGTPRRRYFLCGETNGKKETGVINDNMNLGQYAISITACEKVLNWAWASGELTLGDIAEKLQRRPNLRELLDSPRSTGRGTSLSNNKN